MYSMLEMLYATHVLEGKIKDINLVPESIRENVAQIVADAKKQDGGSTPAE